MCGSEVTHEPEKIVWSSQHICTSEEELWGAVNPFRALVLFLYVPFMAHNIISWAFTLMEHKVNPEGCVDVTGFIALIQD